MAAPGRAHSSPSSSESTAPATLPRPKPAINVANPALIVSAITNPDHRVQHPIVAHDIAPARPAFERF
jgi:hypothetical protein